MSAEEVAKKFAGASEAAQKQYADDSRVADLAYSNALTTIDTRYNAAVRQANEIRQASNQEEAQRVHSLKATAEKKSAAARAAAYDQYQADLKEVE